MKRPTYKLVMSLLVILALLLVACGGQQAPEPTEAPAPAPEPEPTEAPAEEEPEPTEAPAEEEPEPTEAPAEEETAEEASAEEVTITFVAGAVGRENDRIRDAAAEYMEMHPNVTIEVIEGPDSATDRLGLYLQYFEAQSNEVDLFQIDVIWPGDLAAHLIDLSPFDEEGVVADHFPAIVENNTVDGALVGLPWFTDAGLLYYRTDLLEKYGYDGPPATWEELEEMAQTIQDGEQAENPDFVGFVWQGNAYEGLTCDALEWIASSNGGTVISPDGVITINNEAAIDAVNRAAGWVGTISPADVTGHQEEDARKLFQGGNAAFMRNWPYAYSLGQGEDSEIVDLFDVSPLPASNGGSPAAALGGWQLAVSKYSENPEIAADVAYFLASPEQQKQRAIELSLNPTIKSLYSDADVLEASPFFGSLYDVFINATPRPSTATAPQYNEVSTLFFGAVHSVLTGEADAEDALATLELDLEDLTGFPTGAPEAGAGGTLEDGGEEAGEEASEEASEEAASGEEVTVTFVAGAVGRENDRIREAAAEYMEMHPNVTIEVIEGPDSATDRLGLYLQYFEAQSDEVDLFQIDVIWPGDLAAHLIDMAPYDEEGVIADHFPAIVENNTVDGALVGLPWFTDAGLLYYRTDLLEKYGYDGPPATWEELEEMAQTIQDGEQAENPDFVGFVWQGNAYEGLTCDALEWVASSNGGTVISPDGVITINNDNAIDAINRAAGWVGTISPADVTGHQEEDARKLFQGGNAAFMRNWPYAYSLGQGEDSEIVDLFDVSPLPASNGGSPAAALGGWQLAVSKYSKHPEIAADVAYFLASPEQQKQRAIELSLNPTIQSLYSDADVLEASPFFGSLYDVFINATPRPSTATAPQYNEVSTLFFGAVHSVLTGEADAEDALAELELDLEDLTGFPIGEPEGGTSGTLEGDGEEAAAEGEEASEEVEEVAGGEEVTVTFVAGAVGRENDRIREAAAEYMEMHPNVTIEVIEGPDSATDRLGLYLQYFEAQSNEVDLFQIDVIWPGDLAAHLIDMAPYDKEGVIADHFPAIVENNTVNGELVGLPWFTDAGLLYYRTDLLEKYGYDGPPATWEELEEMAQTIQDGEQAENPDFVGFVWQGNAYEGLTCDALEWVASSNGGTVISPDGVITINNENAINAVNRAAGWVGTISPADVTGHQEEDARKLFQGGNAAFMRNWPYAYSLGQGEDSEIVDLFDVSPLPGSNGGSPAAALGGWQLAVSKYSENPEVAADVAYFLASPEQQKQRAIELSLNPTIQSLYSDADVLEASPFFGSLYDVFINATPRPSTATAPQYNEVSTLFFGAVHSVLTGEMDAEDALAELELDLEDLTGFPIGSP